jgi:hypothetical protein
MLSLADFFIVRDCPPELWTSLIVAPEIYDINAGSIGRMHGDTKEATPANAETTTLVSTIRYAFDVIALILISRLLPTYSCCFMLLRRI